MFQTTLEYILGGSVIALLIGLLTLKAKVREAKANADRAVADARKAVADAETVRISNAESATRILVENIVKPLKNELISIRKELADARAEIASLHDIIKSANSCRYYRDCPVVHRLQAHAEEHVADVATGAASGGNRNKADPMGGYTAL